MNEQEKAAILDKAAAGFSDCAPPILAAMFNRAGRFRHLATTYSKLGVFCFLCGRAVECGTIAPMHFANFSNLIFFLLKTEMELGEQVLADLFDEIDKRLDAAGAPERAPAEPV